MLKKSLEIPHFTNKKHFNEFYSKNHHVHYLRTVNNCVLRLDHDSTQGSETATDGILQVQTGLWF